MFYVQKQHQVGKIQNELNFVLIVFILPNNIKPPKLKICN